MDYWVREMTSSPQTIDDLGLTLPADGEADLLRSYNIQELDLSTDLQTAITAGDILRIDGPGGNPLGEMTTSEKAGGDLAGTYPNPAVAAITETGGPTALAFGQINDGQFVTRVGNTLVGAPGGGGGGGEVWKEDEYTPSNGQVTFILSLAPTDPNSIVMLVNGVAADDTAEFTVSGKNLTWLGPFAMDTQDHVTIRYQ